MTHNYNSQGMLSTRAVLGTVYHGEFSWGSEHTYANVHSLYFLGCGNDRVAYCLPLSCYLLSQRSEVKGTLQLYRRRAQKKAACEYKSEVSYKSFPTASDIGYWYIHLIAFRVEDWSLVSGHHLFTETSLLQLWVTYTILTNCLTCLNVQPRRGCSTMSNIQHGMIHLPCCKCDGEAEYDLNPGTNK